MTTRSPVTAANPLRRAEPLPALACRSSLNPSSFASRSRISPEPSFDPSSTTMSSMRSGTASTRRMISSTVVRSLYTGMTTDNSGLGESGGRRPVDIEVESVPHPAAMSPNRLLGFATNWLGDAVMALPAIADVQCHFAGTAIEIAARPSIAPLFSMVPGINRVLTLGKASGGWDELRRSAYDVALLLPNSFNVAQVAWRA